MLFSRCKNLTKNNETLDGGAGGWVFLTRVSKLFVRDCSCDYHIDGTKLDSFSIYRDLGLLTSNILSWNDHIAIITSQAEMVF